MNSHARMLRAERFDDAEQTLLSILRRMHCTVPKLSEERVLRRWFGDNLRKVLMLIVEPVEHRELLFAVRGDGGWVNIERDGFGQIAIMLFTQTFDSGRHQQRL